MLKIKYMIYRPKTTKNKVVLLEEETAFNLIDSAKNAQKNLQSVHPPDMT